MHKSGKVEITFYLSYELVSLTFSSLFLELLSQVFFLSRSNLIELGISNLPGSAINYNQKGLPNNNSKTKLLWLMFPDFCLVSS